MNKLNNLSVNGATILMAALVIARGTSFMFSKLLLTDMGPLSLLGIRFLLAFIIIFAIFFRYIKKAVKKDPNVIRISVILGAINFLCMASELIGLQYTTSSTCAFIENSAIVIVPVMEAFLLRRAPSWQIIVCSVLTMGGIALITVGSGFDGFGLGEFLCVIAALTFAIAIIINGRSSRIHDSFTIGLLTVGTMGFMAITAALVFESPHLPNTSEQWMMLIMLVLVCTCLGFVLQPVAQSRISIQMAGVMFGLNPLTAAVLGWIFMGEALGTAGVIGGLLIIVGIVGISLRGKA
ncbi:DMT family transporter [uncultured Anaerovibrio sp.]|uniref:DMT family transporter n=1 Tax=uncultured Anaerovibrio sp. TaxID=361586 RepID=UPI0025DC5669|nr:DMT family transporter [uncultured Anaerovibrio sp.]